MNLQKKLLTILSKLEEFPKKDKLDVIEFLRHEEWGVAFEVICSVIEQDELSIDAELYKQIEEIGFYIEIDEDLWSVLRPVD